MPDAAVAQPFPSLKQNLDTTKDSFQKNVALVWNQATERRRAAADLVAHSLTIGDQKATEKSLVEWKQARLAMDWLKKADELIRTYPKLTENAAQAPEVPTHSVVEHKAPPEPEEPPVTIEKH